MTGIVLSGRLVTKASVSGVKVSRVGVHKEEYKAYQGVKYVVVADGLEYRVSC
ncbi:hypothetical protein BCR44DRAFT_33635 [Catenaria anguillulae PL171]|uniref:Uncharacterized protein n=1 Tax=Catenaria anguillulae PL171 TaxID=765915 RepID=A0A1Y2HJQ5_9FUNG|nr:hypothetical protein BCR44DRAFT_33635 [Catenaria anguillulae PL171]